MGGAIGRLSPPRLDPSVSYETAMKEPQSESFCLRRQDDNGVRYEMARYTSRSEALAALATFEARGHKQTYFVEEAQSDG
ncbi:MAG: hypothetical protein HOO96_27220 [Polyangiaceae bacterium]|nr:hypothetical protein [Polyangiaceae bacterium]